LNLEIVDISSCKKNVVAEVPCEQVEEQMNQLARKYAQQAKVPGFRPGKVPLNIIRQRYGADLKNDATQEIISRTWKQAVQERSLEPITEPVVEKVEAEPGAPLKFVLSFEVVPALEITDYKGVTVVSPPVEIKDSDLEGALENLRNEHAQFAPVENGEVLDGQYVTVMLDGEFEGGGKPIHEEDATLVVGAPQTNREFSENLLGAKLDETRAFDVTYPEDYRQKRLAGKQVHYKVKVKEIKEKQVAELNDDFARDVGAGNLEELKRRIQNE
jgi:trigger factor